MRLIDADEVMEHVWRDKLDSRELIAEMIENSPTVEIKINFADVQRYCKPRNLLVITRELLDELTHPRNQCCNEKEQNTICKYHRVFNTSLCGNFELCYGEKGSPEVHCGGDKNKCEILDEEDEEQKSVLDKIKAEIRKWYWQADKQAIAKDPCVVDAMIDLFIRTIDKYKAESEEKRWDID